MKTLKTLCLGMVAAAMLLTGCNSMTNTGKGALIGGGVMLMVGVLGGAAFKKEVSAAAAVLL